MTAFDTDDMEVFVDPDMPGYVLATVGGVETSALFSNGYATGLSISGSAPSLLLPSSSAASAAQGTSVSVGGVSYTVTGVEADGTGMTLLRLQEA
jgi:hypothetical protein